MAELHIGAEHEGQAVRRLKHALRKAGARRVGLVWGLFGSQEISNATFIIAGRRVQVEAETYVGVTVSGDDEAIMILSRYL